MEIQPHVQTTLRVTQAELRLIGLGLCRKLIKNEDINAANELNIKLLEGKSRALREMLTQNEETLTKIKSELETQPETEVH